ncbi:TPA: hypothetical protein N3288_000206 [Klebsiella aerogenes]|nr:hypothetical protein [Klebsiella aerogenes]
MAKKYMHFDLEVQDGIAEVFAADAALAAKPDNKTLQRQRYKAIRRMFESVFTLSAFGVGVTVENPDGTTTSTVLVEDLIQAGAVPDEYIGILTDEIFDAWFAVIN